MDGRWYGCGWLLLQVVDEEDLVEARFPGPPARRRRRRGGGLLHRRGNGRPRRLPLLLLVGVAVADGGVGGPGGPAEDGADVPPGLGAGDLPPSSSFAAGGGGEGCGIGLLVRGGCRGSGGSGGSLALILNDGRGS